VTNVTSLGLPNSPAGLTVQDRILVHVAAYSDANHGRNSRAPLQITQPGIAEAVGIERRHVRQYVRPLIIKGLITEKAAYVVGGRQHRKVYYVTVQGRSEATHLQTTTPGQEFPTERITPAIPDSTLKAANDYERGYEWRRAAECYRQVLHQRPHETRVAGTTYERLGNALQRWAFQSDTTTEFASRIKNAISSYEDAISTYDKDNGSVSAAILRCRASKAFLHYWLTREPAKKYRLLTETWNLTRQCLDQFEAGESPLEYGKTFNRFSTSAIIGIFYDWKRETRERRIAEALKYGAQSIRLLSNIHEPHELARSYATTAGILQSFGRFSPDPADCERTSEKAEEYWLKAVGISEEVAFVELSSTQTGYCRWGVGTEKTELDLERALEYAKMTRDRFIIGSAFDWMAYHVSHRARTFEDPIERRDCLSRALRYAEEARRNYSTIAYVSLRAGLLWVESPYVEHYWSLGIVERDPAKALELLGNSFDHATDVLKRAETSGCPDLVLYSHHVVSKTLAGFARFEKDPVKKEEFLQLALDHRRKDIELLERLRPYDYISRGIGQSFLAEIVSELSNVTEDLESKRRLLHEAVEIRETVVGLFAMHKQVLENRESTLRITQKRFQYEYGRLLDRLYTLTDDIKDLRKAAEAYLP
jgi:tetratricopeptide (TPR) repeat protein